VPVRLLLQLGIRNLFRHRRRTALLVLAIGVAVAGVTFLSSLIRGMQWDLRETAVANLTGHIQVLAPGYRDDPGIGHRFPLAADWEPEVPGALLSGWAARIRVPAVIMSERGTRGITLVGVDPSREDISFLGSVDLVGEMLTATDDARILVGRALAEQLETALGYRLVVITQGADGLNREAGFRIAGVYDAEGTGLEKAFVFTGVAALARLLDADGVTEVSIRLADAPAAPGVASRLAALFSGLDVLRWEELEPQAAAMFVFADGAIFIWFLIIMGALVFGLVNALVTAVLERTREFGMLRALGMRARSIVAQVVIESASVMVIGLAAGCLLGIGLALRFADGIDLSRWAAGMELAGLGSRLTPRLEIADVILVVGLSLALSVLASLYPAWRALRIEPLEALRR
jgi:ABC-type lipoprotein release transport system permease subunit